MHNTIKILDKNIQKPNLSNIEVGSMFRFPKGNGDYVYMKINHSHLGNAAVLLSTGIIHSYFDPGIEEVEPVTMLQITR